MEPPCSHGVWRRPKATCSGVYRDFFMGRSSLFRKFRSSRKTHIYHGSEFGEQIIVGIPNIDPQTVSLETDQRALV